MRCSYVLQQHKSLCVRPRIVGTQNSDISIKTVEMGLQVFVATLNLQFKLKVEHGVYLSKGFSQWRNPNCKI